MALYRVVRVAVDGFSGRLLVTSARGRERLNEPFAVEVSALAVGADGAPISVDLDGMLGRAAEVALALGDGGERRIYGIVDEIEQRYGEILLTVAPRVAPLDGAIDHQTFLRKDALAIA